MVIKMTQFEIVSEPATAILNQRIAERNAAQQRLVESTELVLATLNAPSGARIIQKTGKFVVLLAEDVEPG